MNRSPGALTAEVAWDVVIVTSTVPAPGGVVQVISVALTTANSLAQVSLPPISAAVAPINPVPVMMRAVPPAVEPLSGATPVTVGRTGT